MNSIPGLRLFESARFQSSKSILITLVAAVWAMHSACDAASLWQPAGLDPGDQYRVIFITSGVTLPYDSSILTYNLFVSAQAALTNSVVRDLNTSWYAVVSTNATDARINTKTDPTPAGHNGLPIYLVDGTTRIADNYDDLWDGSIYQPVGLTQFRSAPTGGLIDTMAYTGTNEFGTANIGFEPFTMGTSSVVAGFANETSRYWVSAALIGVGGDPHYAGHIYAISGVLTAVPEPASGLLLAAASLCFGARRWQRRDRLMGSRFAANPPHAFIGA